MSYTVPNGQPQGVATSFLNSIREAMIGEIIAINGYASHIAHSDMEDINAVWRHIMQDEKNHYGMFMKLLHQYDPIQSQMYQKYAYDAVPVHTLQIYKPEYDKQLILNNIRDDIKGELEAVILYDQNIRVMPYNDIKIVFTTIIVQEKEHAEHLTRILMQYDPDKYDDLR